METVERLNQLSSIFVTHVDLLDDLEKFKICMFSLPNKNNMKNLSKISKRIIIHAVTNKVPTSSFFGVHLRKLKLKKPKNTKEKKNGIEKEKKKKLSKKKSLKKKDLTDPKELYHSLIIEQL